MTSIIFHCELTCFFNIISCFDIADFNYSIIYVSVNCALQSLFVFLVGDCWLLAALASLSNDESMLKKVIPEGQSFDGEYAGRWITQNGAKLKC